MESNTMLRLAKLHSAITIHELVGKVDRLCTLALGTPEYVGLDAARSLLQAEYHRLYNEYLEMHDTWKDSVKGIISQLAG